MCVELKWKTFLYPEQPFDPASCTVKYGTTAEEGGVGLSLHNTMEPAEIFHSSSYPWTIDGEFGGRKKEVEINNINMAIEYVIPM